jgi:hypothetical protein
MALCFPNAKIVALDAGVEGKDNMLGIELTNKIATEENFDCVVEYGFSPRNTKEIMNKHFGKAKVDFVFIDGLHTNEQLIKDVYGTLDFIHKDSILLYHDVINWKMVKAFSEIKNYLKDHNSILLYRTTSGMGVSIPHSASTKIINVFNCFTENIEYVNLIKQSFTVKSKMKSFIGRFLPIIVKEKIKRILV